MRTLISATLATARRIAKTGPVRRIRDNMRYQDFLDGKDGHLFWGVYSSFTEAKAAAPAFMPTDYNTPEAATLYRSKLDNMDPSEYAVLYWLEKSLRPELRVLDFGGHVGLKYYAFQTVGQFPNSIHWQVYDLPAIVEGGRILAKQRNATNLTFVDDLAQASETDVFLALGSLQFLDSPVYEILKKLKKMPGTVIISKTPMVDGKRFFTLHNIGTAFTPYLIESRPDLIANMEQLGYRLHRQWENAEKECLIRSHPAQSLDHYKSMCFYLSNQLAVMRLP